MGNNQTILGEHLPSPPDKNHPFIIQQIVAQTPQQHHHIISQIADLKLISSPNLLRVIDAHTVQTHNLCSTISYIYALIEHLPHTISTFKHYRQTEHKKLNNSEVVAILIGCSRGLQQLKKEGIEVNTIDESMVFLKEENQQIIVKLMLPFFFDEHLEASREQSLQTSLADLIIGLQAEISEDVSALIDSLRKGEVSINCLEQKLTTNCHKKPKILISKPKRDKLDSKARQSLQSLTSNSQSLLISGEVSQLMFKDFYEHFDNSISDIEMRSMQGFQTSQDQMLQGHKFPKRYIKSKAFRKRKGLWSQWSDKGEEQSITRDQSVRYNVKNGSINFLFDSAKLVQSFIGIYER